MDALVLPGHLCTETWSRLPLSLSVIVMNLLLHHPIVGAGANTYVEKKGMNMYIEIY